MIFLIIGLCTYLYGCNPYVGGLCSRYSVQDFLVTSSAYYVHGKVNYLDHNYTCRLETGIVYATPFKTRVEHRDLYPVGSVHPIQFDTIDGYCKIDSYVENLGTVGFVFLVLAALGIFSIYIINNSERKQELIERSNRINNEQRSRSNPASANIPKPQMELSSDPHPRPVTSSTKSSEIELKSQDEVYNKIREPQSALTKKYAEFANMH